MNKPEPSAALAQLLLFLSCHRQALANAATLLAGPIGGRRVLRLLDMLSACPQMTNWMGRELVALHRLLLLQDVADFDRPEAHYFSLIDPADPVVAEICLLTDGLTDCLHSLVKENLLPEEDLGLAA